MKQKEFMQQKVSELTAKELEKALKIKQKESEEEVKLADFKVDGSIMRFDDGPICELSKGVYDSGAIKIAHLCEDNLPEGYKFELGSEYGLSDNLRIVKVK